MQNAKLRSGPLTLALLFLILHFEFLILHCLPAGAATTIDPASAEREGRELARQLCDLRPEANLTNTGKLVIRSPKKPRREIPFSARILLTETNWTTAYQATPDTGPPVAFTVYTASKPRTVTPWPERPGGPTTRP